VNEESIRFLSGLWDSKETKKESTTNNKQQTFRIFAVFKPGIHSNYY